MAYMILTVELPGERVVELEGPNCRYWSGPGKPTYVGPIEGLPPEVIEELLSRGVIRRDWRQRMIRW